MIIPLPSHCYFLAALGEKTRVRNGGGWAYIKHLTHDDCNLTCYRLTETTRAIVEQAPAKLNGRYTVDYVLGKGVCIIVADHSYGRGIASMLLGYNFILTMLAPEADAAEAELLKHCQGGFVRSMLYNAPRAAFNFELEEDLHWAQLRFPDVEVWRSNLSASKIRRDDPSQNKA